MELKKITCINGGRNENGADYIICETFLSIANEGSNDLETHLNSVTPSKEIQICHNTPKASEFVIKQNSETEEWAIATAIKHDLPQRSMDCTSELNQVIYSDSEISEKVTCARTKTKALLNKVLAQHSVVMVIEDINEIKGKVPVFN
jgi:hypothetical protein